MLCFPNAKINIGLNVTEKRSDGFHNIETIFYPVKLCDVLEFVELSDNDSEFVFENTGFFVDIPDSNNVVIQAFELLKRDYDLPSLKIHLHKNIPFGAGLGGGSANAAFMIKYLDKAFGLGIPIERQEEYAGMLGSDCAFFIRNRPTFAYGRGEKFKSIDLDLSSFYVLMVKPDLIVNTAGAYADIKPKSPEFCLNELIKLPITEWKDRVVNDFEQSIFVKHPILRDVKRELYDIGALYASMSGSGSTIYGIFKDEPLVSDFLREHFVWMGRLDS